MDAHELPCHLEVRDCCEPLQSCKPNRRPTCARKGASTITSRESGPNVLRPSFLLSIDMRPARPDSHQLDTSVLVGGPDGRRSCAASPSRLQSQPYLGAGRGTIGV
jgi:hypothetical protein